MTTGWSELPPTFLEEGDWAIGQNAFAPDRQLFRRVLGALPTNAKLLEVGFGTLIDYEGMLHNGNLHDREYVGYDVTPELVERARLLHTDGGTDGPIFRVQDVLEMDDESAYDVIWVRHVLEHVQDGTEALRRLWRATRGTLILSWFIRPTFTPSEVGMVEGDGFEHWTYSAPRWIALATELGAHLTRIDFDHHATRCSVWLLERDASSSVAETATSFAQSPEFLNALIPVPVRIDERYESALDILDDAYDAVTSVVPLLETIPDLHYIVQDELAALRKAETFMAPFQDEDGVSADIRVVRDAKARAEALGPDDPLRVENVQALRDVARVIETRLVEAGRLA